MLTACVFLSVWRAIALYLVFLDFNVVLHRMKNVYYANLGFLFNDTVDYKVVPDWILVVALEPKQGVSAE